MSGNFFEKSPKISQKISDILSTFSKSIKVNVFLLKLVQNHYIVQNVANFSSKTPKNSQFFLKKTSSIQFGYEITELFFFEIG